VVDLRIVSFECGGPDGLLKVHEELYMRYAFDLTFLQLTVCIYSLKLIVDTLEVILG